MNSSIVIIIMGIAIITTTTIAYGATLTTPLEFNLIGASNNNEVAAARANVTSIDLEVYPEMAEKSLLEICDQAKKNWKLIDILVIHRFGALNVNQKIVLVATFAIHRHDSMAACNYIMDYLKQDAPFWKKEYYDNDYKWLQNTTKTI